LTLEGTKSPATKSAIPKVVGWKLVELGDGKQVRIDQLLMDIPSKTYNSIDEVLQEVRLN
jgi:hypothetical protein